MKILITGSEGNIGTLLVKRLQGNGHDTFCIDITQKFRAGFLTADINCISDMEDVFRDFKPDMVIHLAGIVSRVVCEASPVIAVQTNVIGTYNIAKLCKRYKAKMFFFSTSEVYGNVSSMHEDAVLAPNNMYGLTKKMAEDLVLYEGNEGLRYIIVRPFMIYHENEKKGNNHSAMIRFAEALVKEQTITVHADSVRSWLYIDDALDIIEELIILDGNHIVNIGFELTIETKDLAKLMCQMLKLDYHKHVIEISTPDKMTARKIPVLDKQTSLLNRKENWTFTDTGVRRVINKCLLELQSYPQNKSK